VSVSAADTASDTRAVILPFSNAGGIEATNASLSAPKPLVINPFGGSVTVNNTTPSTKYNLEVNGSIGIDGATPTGSGSSLGLGNTTGFGNGSSGVTVTTNAKGTGTGPTTPQRVVKYLEVDIGGVKFWIPLVQ